MTVNYLVTRLKVLELGESVIMRDGGHAGATIVKGRREWIVVNLENGAAVTSHDRLRLISSDVDGDDSGLNQLAVGCDFDGPRGLWLIPGNFDLENENIEILWDSEAD